MTRAHRRRPASSALLGLLVHRPLRRRPRPGDERAGARRACWPTTTSRARTAEGLQRPPHGQPARRAARASLVGVPRRRRSAGGSAFMLLAIPTLIAVAVRRRLREPARGASIDADAGRAGRGRRRQIPFGEARRQLFGDPDAASGCWLGAFFLGVGARADRRRSSRSSSRRSTASSRRRARRRARSSSAPAPIVGLLVGSAARRRGAAWPATSPRLATLPASTFVARGGRPRCSWRCRRGSACRSSFVFLVGVGARVYQPAYLPARRAGRAAPAAVAGVRLVVSCRRPRRRRRRRRSSAASARTGLPRRASASLSVIVVVAGAHRRVVAAVRAPRRRAGVRRAAAERRCAPRPPARPATRRAARLPRRRGRLRPGAGAVRRRPRGRAAARSSPCSARTAPASRRCSRRSAASSTRSAARSSSTAATSPTPTRVQTAALGIVQVPGGKAVFPTLTVAEHLRAAGWLYRDDPDVPRRRPPRRCSRSFPRLRERIDQMAGNLSGGEQQMLALGMAFIAKPKLLMIDELSLGLAPTIVEQLLDIVRRIQRQRHRDHPRRAVGQRRPHRRRAGVLPGEGRGPLRGPDRRAARARRHPALGVPRGRGAAPSRRRRRRRRGRRPSARRRSTTRRCRARGSTASPSASAASAPSTTRRFALAPRRDPRAHRAQRRRQDDDLRPHLRASSTPDDGPHRPRRRRRHRHGARPAGLARPRPLVPGRPARSRRSPSPRTSPSASSATSTSATTSPSLLGLPGVVAPGGGRRLDASTTSSS